MGKPDGQWFAQMESKIPTWKFQFGVGMYYLNNTPNISKDPWTSLTSSKCQLRFEYRCIERDYRCLNWWGITSQLWGRWRIPLNISHCSFHEESSEENCWFLWGCGAVLCNRWVQIALSNDQNHLRTVQSSCTLEKGTLSSTYVDASHVTLIKIGAWPGTGFEWQMVSTFSVQIFRLGILDYLSRRAIYFGKFPFGQTKAVLPFTSQPKFSEFFGKW